MSRMVIYWLEDADSGEKMTDATANRQMAINEQKRLAEKGIETVLRQEYFR